jgi:dTDP-4-amino-4,6-dideoxygalactose transaminase
MIAARQRIARIYDEALARSAGLVPLAVPAGGVSNYYKYVVMPRRPVDRPVLKAALRERHGVALSGEVYEVPIHKQPVFERWADGPRPHAEAVCARHLCLPVFASMTEAQARQVLDGLRATIG